MGGTNDSPSPSLKNVRGTVSPLPSYAHDNDEFSVRIGDEGLDMVLVSSCLYRHLGVQIDDKLSFLSIYNHNCWEDGKVDLYFV